MKKLHLICILSALFYSNAFADPPAIDRPIFSGPGVGLGASVSNATLDSIYSKILQYNFQYLAISELEIIENRLSDRVFWEFHMGVGAYEPKQMYKSGFVGAKLNLTSGKIFEARRIKSRLQKLQNYLRLSGLKGSELQAMQQKIDSYTQTMDAYNAQKFWKRVGVAFWVPIWGEYEARLHESSISDTLPPAIEASGESGLSTGNLYKDFRKSAVALTYDYGDLATLSLGVNLDRKIFFGVSVDISTPGSEFLNTFRNEMKENFRQQMPPVL